MRPGPFNKRIFSSSIGRKLVIWLLLFSSIITFLGTSLQLFLDYSHDMRTINLRLQQIETSYLESITVSLWTYNELQLQVLLDGVVHLPDIEYIEIIRDGSLLASAGKLVGLGSGRMLERAFPLYYQYRGRQRYLGELTVTANLQGIYDRLWGTLFVILATQGVKTFLVSAFFMVLFYLLVGRHLVTLSDFARGMDLRNLDKSLELKRAGNERRGQKDHSDELDVLSHAFNTMRENMRRDIAERRQIEEEREKLIGELQEALEEIRTLRTILPICSYCKKIRNDDGYYEQIEDYLHKHTGVDFSHTICDGCLKENFPQVYHSMNAAGGGKG